VLRVAARQLGDPVARRVLFESDDGGLHGTNPTPPPRFMRP
jgi:hypothetical protein